MKNKEKEKEKHPAPPAPRGVNPLFIIIALAILARLIYFLQVKDFPFFTIPAGDEKAYLISANNILKGSLLAGKGIFYQDPFYPYFLSLVFSLFGINVILIKLIQFAFGAWLSVYIYKISQKLFNAKTAFVAGIVYAIFPVFYFFEGQLLKSSLVVFFTVTAFYFLLLYSEDLKPKNVFRAGLLLGLASVAQGQSYFFVLAGALWLFFAFRSSDLKASLKIPAIFLAGVLIMMFPITLRNYIVGRDFVLTTYQAGTNFYIGNNEKSTGVYVPLIEGREVPPFEEIDAVTLAQKGAGKKLKPSEVSAYWFSQGINFIKSNPLRWARLTAKKTVLYLNNLEAPDIADYYFVQDHSLLFRIPFFGFGTISALAFISIFFIGRKPGKKVVLLYSFMGASFISVVLFYVFSRYRLQGVAFAVLLASFSAVKIIEFAKSKQFKPLLAALPFFAGFVFVGYYDTKVTSPGIGYDINGQLYKESGAYDKAIEYFNIALSKKPNNALIVFHLMNNVAESYAKAGDVSQAITEYTKILNFLKEKGISSDSERVYAAKSAVGSLYMQARQYVNAQDIFEELNGVYKDRAEIHVNLGNAYKKLAKMPQAVSEFNYALALDTGNIVACNNLANIYRDQKKFKLAREYYDKCLLINPGNEVVMKNIDKLEEMQK